MKHEHVEKCGHDQNGHELLDPRQLAIPIGFKRPETAEEMMRRLIRNEMSMVARNTGQESFDEADDFEVGDEPDLRSPYELDDEQERYREFVEEKPVEKKPVEEDPSPKSVPDSNPKPAPADGGDMKVSKV